MLVCRAICDAFPRKEITFEAPSCYELMKQVNDVGAQEQMNFYVDRWIPLHKITCYCNEKVGDCIYPSKLSSYKFVYQKELRNVYYNKDNTKVHLSEETLKLQQSLFGNELTLEARPRRNQQKLFSLSPGLGKRANPYHNQEYAPPKLGKNESGRRVAPGSIVRIIAQSGTEQVELFIPPSETIHQLAQEVSKAFCMLPGQGMILLFDGNALEESYSAADYNITNGDVIHVWKQDPGFIRDLNDWFSIDITTSTGRCFSIDVEVYDTIQVIKQRIQEEQGIAVYQQRLSFASIVLNDDRKTLSDYHIVSPVQMHLIVRLLGGMYHVASGFSDTTGQFLFTNIQLNGEQVPVHPGWTRNELAEHISEAMETENAATCLAQKFKRTAVSFRIKELDPEEKRLATKLANLASRRNVLTTMFEAMEEQRDEDDEGTGDEEGGMK